MNTPKRRRIDDLLDGLAAASILAPLSRSRPAKAGLEERAVMNTVAKKLDRPGDPVMFGPVIVVGNCAIADCYQTENGGRALLGCKDGNWSLRLCSGDSLKEPEFLAAKGIAKSDAAKLVQELKEAEIKTAPEIDARLSSFPENEKVEQEN